VAAKHPEDETDPAARSGTRDGRKEPVRQIEYPKRASLPKQDHTKMIEAVWERCAGLDAGQKYVVCCLTVGAADEHRAVLETGIQSLGEALDGDPS
jgi:hypothetical protein